jgi:hypothetical protein
MSTVRAFVNIDSAGSGGPLQIFQATPTSSWLLQMYARHAPHPTGATLYSDIFESKIIPSITDFTVMVENSNTPGLDMAWSDNGYVYHTEHDTPDVIIPGSLQHGMFVFWSCVYGSVDVINFSTSKHESTSKFDLRSGGMSKVFYVLYRPNNLHGIFLAGGDNVLALIKALVFDEQLPMHLEESSAMPACTCSFIEPVFKVFRSSNAWP